MGGKRGTTIRHVTSTIQLFGDLLVIKPIHDKFFHPFERVIELYLCGIFPSVAFSHFFCNELEYVRLRWGFERGGRDPTLRKSWINFTWSFTVNVRFAKLARNLRTIVNG